MTVVLVTGAGGPLGANLTRSLRSAPEPVRVVGTEANRWHLPLSLCDATYLVPYAREREPYVEALQRVIAREGVDAILPTHPVEVRAIAELRDRLGVGTALPALATLDVADDKVATQQRLAAAGVPVPRTIQLADPADIERAFAELGGDRPVWVRGAGAPGLGIGGAALPCRDPHVAEAWVAHHRGWGKMAASEYLPGDNLSWMAVFARGALLACAQRQRLEYVLPHVAPSGITGAPAVSVTIARPDLDDLGERAVRALDGAPPHGAFFVDVKGDAAGALMVTEVNAGRCGTTVEHYTQAGFNFPWLLAELALGREPAALPEPRRAVPPEQYWVRTLDCGPVLVRGDAAFDAFGAEP